jgi:Ca-activated chloride channel family protein
MSFASPDLLWLVLAPSLWLAWEWSRRRRADSAVQPHILKAAAEPHRLTLVDRHPAARRIRPWLGAGLALAVVALARPQWGHLDEPVFDQAREILIALDLSRSMQTPDVSPSRLARSKLLIQSLLDNLAGERVGLVVFSGTAFLQAPMSADYEILREFLPALGPDFLPEAGTNYGSMIATAAGAFSDGSGADRYLIVLSDGGANDEDWRAQLPALAKKGVHVIGLGVGTAQGGFIPDGAGGFMKDEDGAVVLAKLESETLRELAAKTGGVYRDAGAWVDLPAVLRSTVDAGRKGKFVDRNTVRWVERYQWALAPALLCLLFSFWWEFPIHPKPRAIRLSPAAGSGPKAPVLAASALALAALLLASRGAAAPAASAPPPAPGVLLGRMVGRLSSQEAPPSALDWAELGRETLEWGQAIQQSQQPVPENPVRDALAGVRQGTTLDPRATDWDKLRSGLEALLQKSEPPKPPPQDQKQKQDQPNKSPQQNQSQQPQSSDQQSKDQSSSDRNKPSSDSKPQAPQDPNHPSTPPSPSSPKSGLGDFQKQPPAPDSGTQQVGGAQPQAPDPAKTDPNLAIPLQKLDEVRNQDSPAELFEMLENQEPKPAPAKKGKDW